MSLNQEQTALRVADVPPAFPPLQP